MIIGALAASANGFSIPFFGWILGEMIEGFSPTNSADEVVD